MGLPVRSPSSSVPARLAHQGLRLLIMVLLMVTRDGAADQPPAPAAPFELVAPSFLRAPLVSRTLLGNTWLYRAQTRDRRVQMMITAMPRALVQAQIGALDTAHCLAMFQQELRGNHARFFALPLDDALMVGDSPFMQMRWSGDRDAHTETGILACGEADGHYYVVHFADALKSSIVTFPPIRAALAALRFNPEPAP